MRTNILYLEDCKKEPCKKYLNKFRLDNKGKLYIEIDKAFAELGVQYEWVYKYTPVDFIGWQIDNGTFDWQKYGYLIPIYCPHNFNPAKYNWEEDMWSVAMSTPELIIYCPEQIK